MRQKSSIARSALAAMSVGAVALVWSAASYAATPSLGPDCGTGAAIVGSDSAGKVTLGDGATSCTLAFSVSPSNPPACTATNETNGGGSSVPVGTSTTTTVLELSSLYPWHAGDVISYLCLEY
jgi:hypothetical protein